MTGKEIVNIAAGYIGTKKGDERHKEILAKYNKAVKDSSLRRQYSPEPRTYQVQVNDAWCATFVSFVGLQANTRAYPLECSCNNQIKQLKTINEWTEQDDYRPLPGDIIYYDWDDDGTGDNVGRADHVGIVEKVSGNTITVIEGNKGNAVARRTIRVNAKYIRGYGRMPFLDAPVKTDDKIVVERNVLRVKVCPSNGLNIRTGPGISYPKCGVLKCGDIVQIIGTNNERTWGITPCGKAVGWICLEYVKEV